MGDPTEARLSAMDRMLELIARFGPRNAVKYEFERTAADIEAEAAHAALTRVRERVEALDASATCRCGYRAAILAIIDEEGG